MPLPFFTSHNRQNMKTDNDQSSGTETEEFLNDTSPAEKPAKPADKKQADKKPPENKKENLKTQPAPPVRNRARRELPDDLPVSRRMAPPLTRRKFAQYRQVGADGVDGRVSEQWLRKIEPQPFEMAPSYMVYDPFEEDITRRNKLLEFVDGTETYTFLNPASGKEEKRVKAKVVNPAFRNGTILIDIEKHYLQFLWMELHPRNESNKRRDTQKRPLFRRVDLDHANPFLEVIRMNLAGDADNYVRSMNHTRRVSLAAGLNIPTANTPPGDLELILRRLAKQDPERVLFTAPDSTGGMRMRIHQAVQNDILEFHDDTQQWFFTSDKEPLHLVLAGKEPVTDLISYLQSDRGKKDYDEMQQQLDYYTVTV